MKNNTSKIPSSAIVGKQMIAITKKFSKTQKATSNRYSTALQMSRQSAKHSFMFYHRFSTNTS